MMKILSGGTVLVALLLCSTCLAFPSFAVLSSEPRQHLSKREVAGGDGDLVGQDSANATMGNAAGTDGSVPDSEARENAQGQSFGSSSAVVTTTAAAVQVGPSVSAEIPAAATSTPTVTAVQDASVPTTTTQQAAPNTVSVETSTSSPATSRSVLTTEASHSAETTAPAKLTTEGSSSLSASPVQTSPGSRQDSSTASSPVTTSASDYSTTQAVTAALTGASAASTSTPEVQQAIKVTETVRFRDQATLPEGGNSVNGVTGDDSSLNRISTDVNNTSSLVAGNSISPLGVTYDDSNSVAANNTFSSSVVPSVPAGTGVPEPAESMTSPAPPSTDPPIPLPEPSPTATTATATVPSLFSPSVAPTVSEEPSTSAVSTASPDNSVSVEPTTNSEPSSPTPRSGEVGGSSVSPLPSNGTAPVAEPETTAEPEPTTEPAAAAAATPETSTPQATSSSPPSAPAVSSSSDLEGNVTTGTAAPLPTVPGVVLPQGGNALDTVPPGSDVTSSPSPTLPPRFSTPEPTTSSAEPESSSAEPESSSAEPESSSGEPESSSAEPETTTAEPTPLFITPEPTPEPSSTPETSPTANLPPVAETAPTRTTSAEPESKPETKPVPSGEPETSAEPEGKDPRGKDGASLREAFAEPGPDWPVAKAQWSFAWEIHVYLLGGLFALVALYTLATMLCLWRVNRLFSRAYFMVLNLLTFCLCALRAVYLLYDGYNSEGTYNQIIDYFLYSTAFPCLTAVFSILFFALLQATHMRLVPAKIQKLSILIAIILVHFVVSIVTDIVVVIFAGMKVMLFVCQMIFIVWGLFLFFGYAYIFRRLYTAAVKRQKNFVQYSSGKGSRNSGPRPTSQKLTLTLAVKVTFVAAIFGLITIGLEIYGIVQVYGVFSPKRPSPWPWWMYHTALRLTELVMCVTMAYIASQPFRYHQRDKSCACCFFCAPCAEMCSSQCCRSQAGWRDREDTSGWSENYASMSPFHNGRLPAGNGKKVVLNGGGGEEESESPVVVQPGDTASADTQADSLLIIEDGFVRFKADTDINQIVDEAEGNTGIVNTAYRGSVDAQHYSGPSGPGSTASYSRKGSLASSGFFRYPSSLSLAESMASEMERAFSSLHADCKTASLSSVRSLPNGVLPYPQRTSAPVVDSFLEQQEPLNDLAKPGLRRSRSAVGSAPGVNDWWKQKLFRSRSDNETNVRTRDVNNQRYMSLLDLERLKGEGEGLGQEECEETALPTCIILRKEQSSLSGGDTDEIDV